MALRSRFATYRDSLLDLYVDKPCHCFGCGCFLLVAFTGLSVAVGGMTMTLDQASAWTVHGSPSTQAWKSWQQTHSSGDKDDEGWPQELWLWYKAASGSTVFTPEMLRDICELELPMVQAGSGVCPETGGHPHGSCLHTVSRLFYGSQVGNSSCPLLPQASVDATVNMIADSVAREGPASAYGYWVSQDFAGTNQSLYTRSSFLIGNNDSDVAEKFLLDTWCQLFDPPLQYGFLRSVFEGGADQMVQYGSVRVRFHYRFDEIQKMVMVDFSFAFCSILFVWLVMYLHIGSFFVASMGMWQIIASLPIAAMIYRKLFMVDYFEFLHILVVYLVLGVGADDIFVLFDGWRHAKAHAGIQWGGGEADVKMALRQTWLRACGAIFNTSFTTGVAFLSMSGSKVMPMKTCGWFAALAIFLNFVFTVAFTPALLVLHHNHLGGKRCCCPNPMAARAPAPSTAREDGEKKVVGTGAFSACVEKALLKGYLPAMQKHMGPLKPVPLFLVLLMCGVAAQGAYFSSQLTPPSKTEEWFPSGHMWHGLASFISDTYYTQEYNRLSHVFLVWGMGDMKFDSFNEYKPDDHPPLVDYDSSFDLSTREAQQAYLDTCQELRDLTCTLEGCRGGKLLLDVGGNLEVIQCVLEDFQRWLSATQNIHTLPTGQTFLALLRQFADQADTAVYSSNTIEDIRKDYRRVVQFENGRLQSVAIVGGMSMLEVEPYRTGVEVRSLMEDFRQRQIAAMPSSMKSLKIANHEFANYDLGEELVAGLFSGMTIAGPLVFVVLLLSTRNIVLALYAIASVGGIVVSVLGFCKSVMDYDLGIGEAIAGIIVIGYSVDYVLHLAHTYCQAASEGLTTREERSAYTIEHMGSTVFAGAITTGGCSIFMFICYLTFFTKMAVLICLTIVFSFLYSMLLFMGLCFLVGPEGNFGSICCCLQRSSGNDAKEESSMRSASASATEPRV